VSPKSGGRAQRRQRRMLLTSMLVVIGITLGSFAAVFAAKWSPRLGLDLAGGVSVVYTAEGKNITSAELNETVNILNLRVNGLGVSGATVQTTGTNQISVSIPGVTNAQGTIAMALVSNQPNSGTSQWFFNLAANGSQLDSQLFTVFGQTNAAGIAVLNKIAAQPVNDYSSRFGSDFATLPTTGGNFVVVSSVVPVPSLTALGFQSAASFASTSSNGISPGELLVIYGQQLGPAQLTTGNGAFPTTLAGTQVTFSGKPAPIIYTSAGQVSVVAPYGIAGLPTVNIVVSYQGVASNAEVFQVKPANPAIFTLNSSGTGDAAIEHFPDFSVINAANPAAPGDVLILFGEGYGAATPATTLPDGAIVGSTVPVVADPSTVLLIDGQPVSTSYFGGAPGLVNGVLQVNFTVPQLAPGSHEIKLQVAGRTSPAGVILHTR